MAYIGIDFGTSNSVVADFRFGRAEVVPNRDGQPWTPSVVTLRRDGSLALGQEAKENFDPERSVRSVKRLLGTAERVPLAGQSLRTEQVGAMLFSLLRRDAERALGEPVTRAVVTVPANSRGLARHATKLCAGAAGLQVLTLINEPTAAAVCYGLDATADQTVLVYDFGGGTLDVTVLRIRGGAFEELSSKGIARLGGDDLDEALGQLLAERFRAKTGYDVLASPYRQAFLLAVERAKIELSERDSVVARKAGLVPERQLSLEEEIDRASFEKVITPLVAQTGEAIDEALKLRSLRPRDIDRVLLVGGSSKIPLVRRFVAEKLGREPEPTERVDPMTCVARGAAVVSAILQGAPGLEGCTYRAKLEHSLCANPIDPRTNRAFLDPIIRRGTDIPCTCTKTYYPVSDPADRAVVCVYEGDAYDNPDAPENVKLAEINWEYKPPRAQRDGALDVTFEYGADGILTVQIVDPYGGLRRRYAVQQAVEDQLDAAQVERLKRINDDLVARTDALEGTPEYREAVEVLKKAELDVIPKVDSLDDRAGLEEHCRRLRAAMAAGDRRHVAAAAATLDDRLLAYAHLL